ncbi:MAG: hypothetical protein KF855_06050 [Acidobacteria bacterium]|nr:hypothetical protein [Acidobacteriota bacterium]
MDSSNGAMEYEAVGLALLIEDEEDRSLYLLELARTFIKRGDWQRAHGLAELMPESYEKAEVLCSIAELLAATGHVEKALSVFTEAEEASVLSRLAAWQQAELLNHIAGSLNKMSATVRAADVRRRAANIAISGQNSSSEQERLDSASVLAEIVENLAAEEKITEALAYAENISSVPKREYVKQRIAEYAANIKRVA